MPRRAVFIGAAALGAAAGVGAIGWRLGLFHPTGGTLTPTAQGVLPSTGAATPASLRLETERGIVIVDAVADGVARVRVLDDADSVVPHSYAIEQELPGQAAKASADGGLRTLELNGLIVSVDATTGAISAGNPGGDTFLQETRDGYRRVGEGYAWQMTLAPDETCHGLGERGFPLSLRGRAYEFWNWDAGSYKPGVDPLYLSVPFYVGHRPGLSYGIFWDNPSRGSIDLDVDDSGVLAVESARRPFDMYIIAGPKPRTVVERFTGLVGRHALPPMWALGYHQTRWSYRDAAAYRAIASRMRAEKIPCDALHFDIDYMSGFRIFTWDSAKFPDPRGLLSDLREEGFRSVAIVDPGIKVDADYSVYQQGRDKELFLTTADGGQLTREVWAGPSEFPDFTKPACRDWWAGHVKEFASAGIAGLWTDMNEPSTFDAAKTLPDDIPHDWEGQGNTHVGGGHNVYGMQMARASQQGMLEQWPDRRPFVFTRAGYAGVQRYASSWNGDSRSSWEHLQMTIPQLLNLGMSGVSFTGSDAGGFRGTPSAELYTRWMQVASMTPFFRTHSARTAPERNPWTYGSPTTDRIREAVERRYCLLPYLYTTTEQCCTDGTPFMRPMFFEDPTNEAYPGIDDQFFAGDHLLVAPIVTRGAMGRSVVLPKGGWYRFEDPTRVTGGKKLWTSAGWGLPIFVRAGAVIPTWPVRQHTGEKVTTLRLDVYAGQAKSHLYEDAGEGFAYRDDGASRRSVFASRYANGTLRVDWSVAGGFTPDYTVVEVRLFGLPASAKTVEVDGASVPSVRSNGVLTVQTKTFESLRVR